MTGGPALLELRDLCVHFPVRKGIFGRSAAVVKAVDGVSFSIQPGETLALVGESGCGKTTIGRTILRSYRPTAGEIILRDEEKEWPLHRLSERELKPLRPKIQMVFQDPHASLNPRMTAFEIISEPLQLNGVTDRREREKRVAALMDIVGLPRQHLSRYPHAFSGGQRQRIGIARALILRPKLIVADEPVSALDVSVQAQILNLLGQLQREFELSFLFISHDLRVVDHISTRVAVMYAGRLVEVGATRVVFAQPLHPYTALLLASIPAPVPRRGLGEGDPAGEMPDPKRSPGGCAFRSRCGHATEICRTAVPTLRALQNGSRFVACHHADELKLRGAAAAKSTRGSGESVRRAAEPRAENSLMSDAKATGPAGQ
jgi:oligopeptide/dipeptide ABC transporter ATP-binding protein